MSLENTLVSGKNDDKMLNNSNKQWDFSSGNASSHLLRRCKSILVIIIRFGGSER